MKRRTKCCLSIILFVLPLSAAEDWRLLTEQMYGPDQERSAEARKQSFSALERLAKGSAEDISKELPQFLRLLDDERELFRQQGSGALAALAMFRVDGLTALQGAIPTFLSQFTNKETRIRENGVRSIAVIRPTSSRGVGFAEGPAGTDGIATGPSDFVRDRVNAFGTEVASSGGGCCVRLEAGGATRPVATPSRGNRRYELDCGT